MRSNTFTNEGYGDLVSENDGMGSSFPTFNGQSSTDAIVDKTATVTDRFGYSAFGGEVSHTGSSTTPFRFVGKQSYYRDPETGLYLLGAGGNPNGAGRYYDPELGRFISRDPIGLAGGDVNLYRYAGNNPVNDVDPSGNGLWVRWTPRACVGRDFKECERVCAEGRKVAFDCKCFTEVAYDLFFRSSVTSKIAFPECEEPNRECDKCTPQQHAWRQGAVRPACFGAGKPRMGDNCERLAFQYFANKSCYLARWWVSQCFSKPDAIHLELIERHRQWSFDGLKRYFDKECEPRPGMDNPKFPPSPQNA